MINEKSILEFARGAIIERVDYEMLRVIQNILDENTRPDKKRSIVLTLEFTPNTERDDVRVSCVAKSKLEPTNPVTTSIWLSTRGGEIKAMELTPQIPGQRDIDDSEQEASAVLRMVK